MATTTRKRSRPQTGPGAAKAEVEEKSTPGIVVDGIKYELNDLTLGELGELEDHVGLPMDLISWGSAKVIAFTVYLVRRRENPNYTLEDASNITIGDVGSKSESEGVVAEVGDSPTEPASE